ncbi:MAG: hypothetical protein WCP17_03735 [bacterium]
MRKCSKCSKEKTESEFNFKFKNLGILQYQCKNCTRLSVKNHYNRNRGYYLEKVQKRNILLRQEVINYVREYFLVNPCIDCGESDPVVLEFDHRGEIAKFRAVSSLIRGRFSLEKIKQEIGKCDVRCANCHRRKTAKEFKWLKGKNAKIEIIN